MVVSLLGVFKNSRRLGMGESYIPVLFFDPLLHRSPCFPDVDFVALAGNPVDNAIFFSRLNTIIAIPTRWRLNKMLANFI